MDPFSLSVGIIVVVKDTYKVANFIYTTIKSAHHADDERDEIISGMRFELLFLRSFVSYFERAHRAVTHTRELDKVCVPYQRFKSAGIME